ncbi:MAG: immune inhibitor A, partial [Desulfobacterales bacterium]
FVAARYDRPGGPFDPYSGEYYVYSQMADMAFKRLGRTITLPAGAPALKFMISFDIEFDWDYAFVEIREVGTDDWTTLPDLNGLTTQSTGDSCTSGWVQEIHPFLANYMDEDCNPSGLTGDWHAFTGSSSGWQPVEIDLSAYAGKEVEIHISYATDWATQNLGVFVDNIEIADEELEDFEDGLGDWAVSVAPGSGAFNNWVRISGAGFPEGPAIRTDNTIYLGFGFEAIDSADSRVEVMDRVMNYFGQ